MEQIVKTRSWNMDNGTASSSPIVTPTASVTSDAKTTNVNVSVPNFNIQPTGYFGGVLGLAGVVAGLWMAYKNGSKWYVYLGYAFLFGILGGLVGEIGDRTIKAIRS